MNETATQFQSTLKNSGKSLTKTRRLIFNLLRAYETQTMADIVAACKGQVDRATVYRTIILFEKLGIVQRLQIGWKYKLELTDAFGNHHHHLTCSKCSTVIPIAEDTALEAMLDNLAHSKKFIMQGHQLEIQGLCQRCSTV